MRASQTKGKSFENVFSYIDPRASRAPQSYIKPATHSVPNMICIVASRVVKMLSSDDVYRIVLVRNSVIVASKWIIDGMRSVRAFFEVEVELNLSNKLKSIFANIQERNDNRDMQLCRKRKIVSHCIKHVLFLP